MWLLSNSRLHLLGCLIALHFPIQSGCRWQLLAARSTWSAANLAGVVVQVGAGGQHALTVPVIGLALLEQIAVARLWCSVLFITVQLCLPQTDTAPDQCLQMEMMCFLLQPSVLVLAQ